MMREQRVGEIPYSLGYLGWSAYLPGMRNPTADAVPRVDRTVSDENLATDYSDPTTHRGGERSTFGRLICRGCCGTMFEVLSTGDYETTARCPCGLYYVVHSG